MNGQVRRLSIRGDLGSYSLLVYQVAEEGNTKEVGAHWAAGMGLCVGQSQGSVYSLGRGRRRSFIQGQELNLSPESDLELELTL